MMSVVTRIFRYVGRAAVEAVESVGKGGHLAVGAAQAVRRTGEWRGQLIDQMARIGVDSIPIALFIATFTGVVLALQAEYSFTGAVPLYFVGTLVGKTIILELGPVLTGIALAGRVGANIASELGSMRVTEQVDALEALGYDPVGYLVVPRVLAGALMFPVVVVLAITVGVAAGWATSLSLLDLSSPQFIRGLRLFFATFDVWFALVKAVSFGLVVTTVGCHFGFHASGGAAGVGRATTRAVVVGSMIILALDAFWAAALLP